MRGSKKPEPIIDRRIVADSGPLCVLLCAYNEQGAFDAERARQVCSRESDRSFYKYQGEDLLKILAKNRIVVTPHILTEISNNVRKEKFRLSTLLQEGNPVAKLLRTRCSEVQVGFAELMHEDKVKHIDLGFTDCALMIVAHPNTDERRAEYLLTDDAELQTTARSIGIRAMTARQLVQQSEARP